MVRDNIKQGCHVVAAMDWEEVCYSDPYLSLVLYDQHSDLHLRVGVMKEGHGFLCRKHTKTDEFSGQILILFITMFITTGFSCQYVYLVGRQYF